MIVISDTSGINYLVLIEEIDVLERLYRTVTIPPAVQRELLAPRSPEKVRTWLVSPPDWLHFATPARETMSLVDSALDAGEREAIALAIDLHASLVLIDDSKGRYEAELLHVPQTGTLGVLVMASERSLIDLRSTLSRLRQTSFFVSEKLIQRLLNQHPNL